MANILTTPSNGYVHSLYTGESAVDYIPIEHILEQTLCSFKYHSSYLPNNSMMPIGGPSNAA